MGISIYSYSAPTTTEEYWVNRSDWARGGGGGRCPEVGKGLQNGREVAKPSLTGDSLSLASSCCVTLVIDKTSIHPELGFFFFCFYHCLHVPHSEVAVVRNERLSNEAGMCWLWTCLLHYLRHHSIAKSISDFRSHLRSQLRAATQRFTVVCG